MAPSSSSRPDAYLPQPPNHNSTSLARALALDPIVERTCSSGRPVLIDDEFDEFFFRVVVNREKLANAENQKHGVREEREREQDEGDEDEASRRRLTTNRRRPTSAAINRVREAGRIEHDNARMLRRLRNARNHVDAGTLIEQHINDEARERFLNRPPPKLAHEKQDARREVELLKKNVRAVSAQPTRDQRPRALRVFWEEGRQWRNGTDFDGDTPVGARTKREVRERGRAQRINDENARLRSRIVRARGGERPVLVEEKEVEQEPPRVDATRRELVEHARNAARPADKRAAKLKEIQEARKQRAQAAFLLEFGATQGEFETSRKPSAPCKSRVVL